jgi:hypothetical protein
MHRRQSYLGLQRVITQSLCEVVLGGYPELGQRVVVVMNTQRKFVLGNVVRVWWALGGFLVYRYEREACLAGRLWLTEDWRF